MKAMYRFILAMSLWFAQTGHAGPYGIERQEIRAQLSPQRYTTIGSELGAKINRIHVKEGSHFSEGQLLVEFDCALQAAQLDRAKSQLSAAEVTLAGNRRLAQLNSVGQVELQTSEAEVSKSRADVAYIQATLGKCEIHAPFTGKVSEQKAREQQFVQPGQPLLDILDDSTLELEFIVPSRWLNWLRPGHTFKVMIDETGRNYPARLMRIGARADPISQSVKAVAVINGKFPELISGMSGRILITPSGKP